MFSDQISRILKENFPFIYKHLTDISAIDQLPNTIGLLDCLIVNTE